MRKLIAGPNATICDRCVSLARKVLVLRQSQTTSATAIAFVDVVDSPCGFCRKRVGGLSRPRKSHPLDGLAAVGEARICSACLDLCDAILEEDA